MSTWDEEVDLLVGGSGAAALSAVGNTTATVMGRTCPGAGSTIAPATVFGCLAARHSAAR